MTEPDGNAEYLLRAADRLANPIAAAVRQSAAVQAAKQFHSKNVINFRMYRKKMRFRAFPEKDY